jgi:hypothetical protein
MRSEGQAMPALPASVTGIIRENRTGETAMPLATDVKSVQRTDWILSGARTVELRIVEQTP